MYLGMTTTTPSLVEQFEAAAAAIKDGEARGLGRTAMAKRYKALFAAEDALKARDGWK
ncbi:MAG: hypothetical protein AMXMBFR56_65740 [Polyangiaceae bacterium]